MTQCKWFCTSYDYFYPQQKQIFYFQRSVFSPLKIFFPLFFTPTHSLFWLVRANKYFLFTQICRWILTHSVYEYMSLLSFKIPNFLLQNKKLNYKYRKYIQAFANSFFNKIMSLKICPRSSYPFYIVGYYMKRFTTSCTYSTLDGLAVDLIRSFSQK